MVEQRPPVRESVTVPRRRAVLRALAGGGLVALAGCNALNHGPSPSYTTKLSTFATFSVAVDRTTALVGTLKYPLDPTQGPSTPTTPTPVENPHIVAAFNRGNEGWTEGSRFLPEDIGGEGSTRDRISHNGNFGASPALDGDTALIGSTGYDSHEDGPTYVFERTGTGWVQQAAFVPPRDDGHEPSANHFGFSVSLDGDTALVGSNGVANSEGPGAAYVYERTSDGWTMTATLTTAAENIDRFGESVALGGDTAIIGATNDTNRDADDGVGAAYVFERTSDGWTETGTLTRADENADDDFGDSVALASNTALIGSVGASTPTGSNTGAAFVYERTSDGWTEATRLVPATAGEDDNVAESVAVAGDGNTALISGGDVGEQSTKSGDAFVFTRGSDGWSEATTLAAGVGDDQVGSSVAITDDGGTALLEGDGGAFVFDV